MYYRKKIAVNYKMINMIFRVFRGILDHYNEKIFNAYSKLDSIKKLINQRVITINESVLGEAINKGKGVILATGHFGGIELLPSVFTLKGYPVSIICRFQNQLFSRCIRERADLVGIDIIEGNNMNTIKLALMALKNGKILITECDELNNKIKKNSTYINFLGYKISYDRTIDILQKRSGAAVVFGLMKRNQNKIYELIIYNNIINNTESNIDIMIGKRCLKLLEDAIYSNPDQWYQWNKFGKYILYNRY
jgi:Kdo2-lipid IVA lauroyltransferase/acyltransferase